jgi:hypothetical protein
VDGGCITTNISHVPKEGSDDLHEDVGPDILIERAFVIDCGKRIVDGLEDLLVQHVRRHCGEVNTHLQDLLKVVTAGNALFGESFLHSNTVERHDVDDVREICGQSNELEDVPDLGGGQPVDVIDHHDNGLVEGSEGLLDLSPATANAFLPMLEDLR